MDRPAFIWFGPAHIGAMLATLVIGVALALWLRRGRQTPAARRLRRVICGVLGVGLLASWLAEDLLLVMEDAWTPRYALPLHLCDVALVLCVAALLGLAWPRRAGGMRRGVQTAYELAYFWGLSGTTQAILTPDLSTGFPSFTCIRYFVTHGGIIVAILIMTIGLRMRPRPGAPWRAWLATAAVAVPVGIADWALDANYMYLCGPPGRPSLYDYLGPWPWTLLSLAGLGVVLMAVCYLPFWIADWRARSRAERLRAA